MSVVLTLGCGEDSETVNPADRLCRGESGFAAQISGTPEPFEMCVSNENTLTSYIPGPQGEKYNTLSSIEIDGTIFEVEIGFFVQPSTPTTLLGTSNRAQAESDPGSILFVYREIKPGQYEYESVAVTGIFTVTFNDPSVAVVTFGSLEIDLDDVSTGNPVGSRAIPEGYLSVTAN
jgi:hypothetical protein